MPSVFNLSSRKKDFVRLVKNLSAIFLESTNAEVLDNCALALASLGQGDHSRTRDAEAALKKTVRTLQSRLLELLQVKAAKEEGGDNGSKSGDDDEEISLVNTQQSISLCLRRLSILSKRVYVGELLIDSTVTDAQDEAVEGLFNTVAEYVAKELNSRKIEGEESVDEEESVFEIPPIWENADKQIHSLVAEAVCDGLNFSLCVTAWRLETEIESKEDGEYDADKEHIVLRMREYLMKLCALCYEQHLRGSNMDAFSKEHQSFSIAVQKQAGNIVGDLRSLFPDAWATSTSPFLSACGKHSEHPALTGGMLRFLSDMEGELRACEKDEEKSPVAEELLLPLARGLTANWLTCNRREAGAALAHIVGSGVHAGSIVSSMSRVFKKVRFKELSADWFVW